MNANDLFRSLTLREFLDEEGRRIMERKDRHDGGRMVMTTTVAAKAMMTLPAEFIRAVETGRAVDEALHDADDSDGLTVDDVSAMMRGWELLMIACALTLEEMVRAAKANDIALPAGADWPETALLVSRFREKYGVIKK